MKRQYKIILIILLIILLSVGAYFGIRALISSMSTGPGSADVSTTTDTGDGDISVDTGETDVSTTTEEGVNQVPVLISDQEKQVFDFWINENTNTINYITISGSVYSVEQGEQNDKEVSNQNIRALNFIEQSPSNQYVLVAFGNPKNPNWGIFDITDNAWRPLPSSIDQATWLHEEDGLVIIVEVGSERRLEKVPAENGSVVQSNIGTDIIVPDFRLRDIKIKVLPDGRIIVEEKPSTTYASRIWEINPNDSSINNLISGEMGLSTKWSDDFMFKFNTPNNFFILNHNLNNAAPVLFTTLPTKCGQGDLLIYCGVPQSGFSENNNDMPNKYLWREVFTVDNLYRINPNDPKSEIVFESGIGDIAAMDIKNLRVFNGDVYFINRYDEGLYRVSF